MILALQASYDSPRPESLCTASAPEEAGVIPGGPNEGHVTCFCTPECALGSLVTRRLRRTGAAVPSSALVDPRSAASAIAANSLAPTFRTVICTVQGARAAPHMGSSALRKPTVDDTTRSQAISCLYHIICRKEMRVALRDDHLSNSFQGDVLDAVELCRNSCENLKRLFVN